MIDRIRLLWETEPLRVIAAISTFIAVLGALGVSKDVSEALERFLLALVPIIGLLIGRQKVIPVAKVEAVGGKETVENATNVSKAEVAKTLVVLLAVALFVGCASSRGALVLADDAIHDSLASVDDSVRRVCAETKVDINLPCLEVRKTLLIAFEAHDALNRSIENPNRPTAAIDLLAAVGRLGEALKKLPQSEITMWAQDLLRSIAAAYQLIMKGK